MKHRVPEIPIMALLTIIVLAAHLVLRHATFSYAPAPLLLATLCTWLLPGRWYWLVLVALVAELLSTLPLGVMAAVVALPYLLWKLRGTIENNASFPFFILVACTTLLQFSVITAAALWPSAGAEHFNVVSAAPWRPLLTGTAVSAGLVWLVCRLLYTYAHHAAPVVALSHIRYGRSFD